MQIKVSSLLERFPKRVHSLYIVTLVLKFAFFIDDYYETLKSMHTF